MDEIHFFYRKETLKLAVKGELHTIICDGVHSFHPSELGRKAQLYSLHGVCGDAQAKSLVYAITANKLTTTYLTIFQHVASRLEKYGANIDKIKVVLDFEMAAHNAAEQTLDRVGLILRGPVFTHGQAYVAFSRVRKSEDVKIKNCNPQAPRLVYNEVYQNVLY
ncbi:hypothetical protein WR25_10723 [Diploscapter pachys]|uniref:MULE transposase domain-containing protein n=1 Tax=Diploscapter pachys TaxID=2018661 RepID=A0A2A2KYR6_9BILA|nr:hypothetical protein WR25_10723 [Diploscapter pachys]